MMYSTVSLALLMTARQPADARRPCFGGDGPCACAKVLDDHGRFTERKGEKAYNSAISPATQTRRDFACSQTSREAMSTAGRFR